MVATVCTAFTAVEEKSLKLPSTVCVPAGGRCKMKTCLRLLKIGGRTAACERKKRKSTTGSPSRKPERSILARENAPLAPPGLTKPAEGPSARPGVRDGP